jgi:hypothetical protein
MINWNYRADYTGAGKSQWAGTSPVDTVPIGSGAHNVTHSYILHGEVLKTSGEKTGAGSLDWIEFQIIKAPGEGEVLTSEIRVDTKGLFESGVMDKEFNNIPITYGKTIYSYSAPFTPPPPAKIYVNPALIMNRTATPGENFTVDVNIQGANIVAYLEFRLSFTSTTIKAWEAKLGDFFPPSATVSVEIDNTTGFIHFIASLSPTDPLRNGSGTIATIKFHVEALGSSTLHLSDIQLKDRKNHQLPFTSTDGYFSNSLVPGDVNGDGKVDINDVARVSGAFGSYPGHPRWNDAADLNRDNSVNVLDMILVCLNFGQPR